MKFENTIKGKEAIINSTDKRFGPKVLNENTINFYTNRIYYSVNKYLLPLKSSGLVLGAGIRAVNKRKKVLVLM